MSDMPRVAVKICGLREAAHVAAAVTAGADMIGFVFAPGKRRVTPAEAAMLIAGLRAQPGAAPLTVGLIVNTPP
jgi:phosphoribosylanthranilate isomerase